MSGLLCDQEPSRARGEQERRYPRGCGFKAKQRAQRTGEDAAAKRNDVERAPCGASAGHLYMKELSSRIVLRVIVERRAATVLSAARK